MRLTRDRFLPLQVRIEHQPQYVDIMPRSIFDMPVAEVYKIDVVALDTSTGTQRTLSFQTDSAVASFGESADMEAVRAMVDRDYLRRLRDMIDEVLGDG